MNKKATTIIITVICFLSVAVLTVFYLSKQGIINTDNIFTNNAAGNNNKNTVEPSNSDSEEKDKNYLGYPVFTIFLKEGAEYNFQYSDEKHNMDEYSDFYIKFNSMEITKEKGDFDDYEDVEAIQDESGRIINDYSYVVCHVTIINKGERMFSYTINGGIHLTLPNSPYLSVFSAYNSAGKVPNSKDYGVVDFEPGQEYNFNLAYIINDSKLQQFKDNGLLYSGFMYQPDMSKAPIIEKQQEKTDG